MDTVTLADRVKKILSDHLGYPLEAVTDEANLFDDLDADSLDTVELVMAVEEEFGIEIPDSDGEAVATVADMIARLPDRKSVLVFACSLYHAAEIAGCLRAHGETAIDTRLTSAH